MADPKVGEMILYDYARPPLLDGEYRLRVATDVTIDAAPKALEEKDAYFDVVGPRFSLAATEVAAVFPPRNGHGAFHDALPHVALGRRTLPWERALGDAYTAGAGATPYPWLALVLFEEGEYELKRSMPLEQLVPSDVFQRMGRPQAIRCDAVEADASLLRAILPMPEELQLLTHVRRVNVDDRELAAGDSDGYFAVVMANRIPSPGVKHRACLVSVEERTDLLPTADSPLIGPGALSTVGVVGTEILLDHVIDADVGAGVPTPLVADAPPLKTAEVDFSRIEDGQILASTAEAQWSGVSSLLGARRASRTTVNDIGERIVRAPVKARLVLLHSWSFECEGDGTFRELMQHLSVGMMGDVAADSGLAVSDTGHIRVQITSRAGVAETAWYRGPLVNAPLSRDPNGPYHSADQARRVAADTGAEDVSYAAAFEVGRLLAAADARLAQELMRWRRGAYRQAARADSIDTIAAHMTLLEAVDLHLPLAALLATSAIARLVRGAGPLADRYGMAGIERSPFLQPEMVQRTFALDSVEQANVLLGRRAGVLDAPIEMSTTLGEQLTTLDAVLRDTVGVRRLADARARMLDNAKLLFRTPTRIP